MTSIQFTNPTLVRLSFWVPPKRLAEFEAAYHKQLAPILQKHDWLESSEASWSEVEGVFSRFFEVETPAEINARKNTFQQDPTWQEALRELGETFGRDNSIPHRFALYRAPAGAGKTVEAGAGVRRGLFQTLRVQDGLPSSIMTPAVIEDRMGHLWFGTFGGVSCYDGQTFTTFTTEDGLPSNIVNAMLEDRQGNLWFGTGYGVLGIEGDGVSCYDGQTFITFTTEDGLAGNTVNTMLEDRQGNLWFGTWTNGVSRYDGAQFVTFTAEDGLAHNEMWSVLEDREDHLWFGTWGGGVSRYDGAQFATFTTKNGLVNNAVMSLLEDEAGDLWFGTWEGVSQYDGTQFATLDSLGDKNVRAILEDREGHFWFGAAFGGGLSRYEGEQLTTFSPEDGLAHDSVQSILEDREGNLWFGTWGPGKGVSRYDGTRFVTFTTEDGLVDNTVNAMLEDRKGNIWFGTGSYGPEGGGVSRYDGTRFVTFTTEDGLVDNTVIAILEDRKGNIWFGTWGGGVSCYDGQAFTTFTTEDGLADNTVIAMLEDREGHLLFGTYGGGVSLYNGQVFQSLSRNDGLVSDMVLKILQDRNGAIWIATAGGLTRYRPHHTPPTIRLTDVIADRRYEPVQEMRLPVSQEFVILEFQGRSLTTRPDSMAYVYRLDGYDANWQVSYARRAEYQNLPLGEYTFQVKAVDRDLNYSEPVAAQISVIPDPHLEALAEALSAGVSTGELVGKSAALRQVQAQLAEHVVQRAVIVCRGTVVRAEDITLDLGPVGEEGVAEIVPWEENERRCIWRALEKAGWVIKGEKGAAALLGIPDSTLRSRMKRLGIKRP